MTEGKSAVERLAEKQLEQLEEFEAYRKEANEHRGQYKDFLTGEWKPYALTEKPFQWAGYDVPSICLGVIIASVIFVMLSGSSE